MIFSKNEHLFRALDVNPTHYFTIEAFNENGISKRTNITELK